MHPKTRQRAWSILAAFLVIFLLAPFALAKSGKKGTVQFIGFCVANGKLFSATKSRCQKGKGIFFKNRKEAMDWQDAQTNGFCYLDGRVIVMKKGNCLKRRGKFFTNKGRAMAWAENHKRGFCCLNGRVFSMAKEECTRKKGAFALLRNKALEICDPLGWCLTGNLVSHLRKSACLRKKGRFFSQKAEADKAARSIFAGAKNSKGKGHKASTGMALNSLPHKAMPFLGVERIYLEGNTVHLSLKNKGKARLSPGMYRQGSLVLKVGTKTRTWPLSRVDKKGYLNRGATVTFNTGLKIKRQAAVQVSFRNVPGEKKGIILMLRNIQKGTQNIKIAHSTETKANKAQPALLPAKRVRGHSPARQGLASESTSKDITPWLRFVYPSSGFTLCSPELRISYHLSPAVRPGPITFFLLRNGHIVAQTRRYILQRVTERRLQTFYWFLNELPSEENGTGYRIGAITSGHPEVFSESFRIALSEDTRVFCSIVERDTQFYQDETLHIQAWNPQRYHLVNCRLFFVPVRGSGGSGIRVPIDSDPHSTSFEVSLAVLEPGEYRLRFVADVVHAGEPRRIISRNVEALSRPFSVLARPSPEPSVLEVSSPEEGYRLPLDISVTVRWHVVSGWQNGDRIVCRLRHGTTELYNRVRYVQHGLLSMFYNHRITADAEGEYQIVVEHRRGDRGEQLLNSATRNFVWFFHSRRH